MLERILEMFPDETLIVCDGFDDCVIGVSFETNRLIYSVDKMIAKLIAGGMSEDDAVEYFEFNIAGGFFDGCPIWMREV
jgi:hypothetical protein